MSTIRAVTFDFWSTLYVPCDREQLSTVREGRAAVLRDVLAEAGFPFPLNAVQTAFQPPSDFVGPAVTLHDTIDAMCKRLDIGPPREVQRRLVRALD